MTPYQEFIYKSRYARWNWDKSRRENLPETVDRYLDFMCDFAESRSSGFQVGADLRSELREGLLGQLFVPSMRALMTAGPALERDHLAGYNCAYLAIDSIGAFSEALYILMCGTGVGFSVERQFINRLPLVPTDFYKSSSVIKVEDSKYGWAKAYRELIIRLYSGELPTADFTDIRPAGAPLKTFGGRASGPDPLQDLFEFTTRMFMNFKGRRLNSIACHDIMCKVGEIVVVGGVRRSAMISLSNLSDNRMRDAKAGEWWHQNPHRRLANNSVAFTEKPDSSMFMEEWLSLAKSGSGERGIFNREAAQAKVAKLGRRDPDHEFGTNPCSEIILRPNQLCNLTEGIVRASDDMEDLKHKIRMTAILGTFQSMLTDFKFVNASWQKNCEEERLLGVSLTGIMDNKLLNDPYDSDLPARLEELRECAVFTNREFALQLGINQSAAVTCVKPSGTASQYAGCSSGIHSGYAHHFIRRVRGDMKDPITKFMIEEGVPYEIDIHNDNNAVFEFGIDLPEDSVTRNDYSAIDQLRHWQIFNDHWCEHKPSITVSVREDEWPIVGAFVWENFDTMSGVSFLPYDGGTYKQAPYEEVSAERTAALQARMPNLDWRKLDEYEHEDNTAGAQTLACTGGVCELVDLVKEG